MQSFPTLRPGDSVEIIAPASRCSDQQLQGLKDLLSSWQLHCVVDEGIFGDDLLCANSDKNRSQALERALTREGTKAVICARGGYGSARLITSLSRLTPPPETKILVGMSDITALHLYLQQHWQWATLHAAISPEYFSAESMNTVKELLFGDIEQVSFNGTPLNAVARENKHIDATITGGNLSLLQTSIGTAWQLSSADKIIFIEEVGERAYRVDRMLEHMSQAKLFAGAKAIVFGDFLGGNEPDGSNLISDILSRFAEQIEIPVMQIAGVGHGKTNMPIPLGTKTSLQLGDEVLLTATADRPCAEAQVWKSPCLGSS